MTELWRFREFCTHARTELAEGWGAGVVGSWLDGRPRVVEELRAYGGPGAHERRIADSEESWGLYAMSRLTDLLIAPYQPVNAAAGEPSWRGPTAGRAGWPEFIEHVGAARIAEDRFHPFFHEIVDVEPAEDPDAPPELVAEVWPGAMLGTLLLVRAGVVIRAGARHCDPEVAARSRLNWTWYRRNREAGDLSHGWGANSQWRTEFRRDHLLDRVYLYDVDHLGPAPSEVNVDSVRYRHGLHEEDGDDWWQYDTGFAEPRAR